MGGGILVINYINREISIEDFRIFGFVNRIWFRIYLLMEIYSLCRIIYGETEGCRI